MAYLYILYSHNLNRYYNGSCLEFDSRYKEHLQHSNSKSFTAKTDDWEEFLVVDSLHHKQARKMEIHIKSLKSAKYIANLKIHPEIIEKLKSRFQD